MLIVLEGPNGVGKSTVARHLAERLERVARWRHVVLTREPTATPFGDLIRGLEGEFPGRALGLACAADRWYHLAREVEPALLMGDAVVSDRYLASSLVLQGFDGIDANDIWSWHEGVRTPDLSVYLEEDTRVIEARIASRASRSRFESSVTPQDEIDGYRRAQEFLSSRGWRQITIDCAGRAPHALVDQILDAVD